jgi:hypothetical protein
VLVRYSDRLCCFRVHAKYCFRQDLNHWSVPL